MSAFNRWCFDPPSRAITLAWADTGLSFSRLEENLIPGTVLWRIGSSTESWHRNATSAWWVTDATFGYITTSAERVAGERHRLDRTFRRLARMKLAILPSWKGRGDLVVRLSLRSRARVFLGRGKLVEDDKDNLHYRALGAFEIEQVFLPGLSWWQTTDPAAVGKVPRKPVPTWQDHATCEQFAAHRFFAA